MDVPDEIAAESRRARRGVAVLGFSLFAVIALVIGLSGPHGGVGVTPGRVIPPFAVPLALGTLNGDANVAAHANDGEAGRRPACSVRGAQILNVCELYEHQPVVLALFINRGKCANVLSDFQTLAPAFHGVRFASVAIKGDRGSLRRLISAGGLALPVGYDRDGSLVSLYRMVDCPQITFIEPGGVAASRPLLGEPSLATLRGRIGGLVAAARARGWRPAA
jgi:hypothetical protein